MTQTAPVSFCLHLYCLRSRSNGHKGAVTEKIRQPLPATFHQAMRILHSGHGWLSIQPSFSPDVVLKHIPLSPSSSTSIIHCKEDGADEKREEKSREFSYTLFSERFSYCLELRSILAALHVSQTACSHIGQPCQLPRQL